MALSYSGSPGSSDECTSMHSAPDGCQPSDQAKQLGCESAENWLLPSTSTIAILLMILIAVGSKSRSYIVERSQLHQYAVWNSQRYCTGGGLHGDMFSQRGLVEFGSFSLQNMTSGCNNFSDFSENQLVKTSHL